MAYEDSCVGMAANMIGVKKRIIAFLDESGRTPTYTVMLNPEIIKKDGAYSTEESCLSLLGGPRPCKIKYQTLEFQTRIGPSPTGQLKSSSTKQIIAIEF